MTPLKINTLDSKIEDFFDARNYALGVVESYINGQISSKERDDILEDKIEEWANQETIFIFGDF